MQAAMERRVSSRGRGAQFLSDGQKNGADLCTEGELEISLA